jgi:hypothetical protein
MLFNVNNIVLVALAASPLVAAHGKVAVLAGDAGGNGTALGIQGAVVAGAGSNSKTELDTTVFGSTKIATNGLGKTSGGGQNTLDGLTQAVALSGSTLPQVSSSNGSLSGTFHIVTTDGAGPVQAVVDPTATGQYESGTAATVATQVPGTRGNIAAPKQRRFIPRTLVKLGLLKRASNVNEDYPIAVQIPAGTTCTGSAAGQSNICLVKIANSNPAGPFGGSVAFQIANSSTAAAKRDIETEFTA